LVKIVNDSITYSFGTAPKEKTERDRVILASTIVTSAKRLKVLMIWSDVGNLSVVICFALIV
jgi:hypothetical protein